MINGAILPSLVSYYERKVSESIPDVASAGFEKKEIPFIVQLDSDGKFIGLQDTRQGEGKIKPGRSFMVPKAVERTSGVAADILWGTPAYVVGRPKPDESKEYQKLLRRAETQHKDFIRRIKDVFPSPITDEGIRAVIKFLDKQDFSLLLAHPDWHEVEENGLNVTFQLSGDDVLVCQSKAARDIIISHNAGDKGRHQTCLITGQNDQPVRLHTSIKGVWGAQSSGANIVSFNLDAFDSYEKKQGDNAPVGKIAEFAYTTALNTLLAKGSRQRIQVGDASTVFWAINSHQMENMFADFFGGPAKETAAQDNEAIKSLYSSPRTGAPPLDDDMTPFYVLGLSPNASRISVRFWYSGTVGEVATHIRQHFDDCAIVHGPNQPEYLSLFRLLTSTSIQGKSDNINPNLAGAMMKAILNRTPYPQMLLASLLRRNRAEREITYPRASLIKAVLLRSSRYYGKNEKEVGMSIDLANTSPGYLTGRLFAVLERAQESANPGIKATIRDRFYGAASSTPVVVFPQLMKLKNHHISKLENKGQAINLEKMIGGIIDGLNDFPAHLSMTEQGRFAIGYYHQRQDFFTKKEKEVPNE